jgi:hypothetical protein
VSLQPALVGAVDGIVMTVRRAARAARLLEDR